MAYTDEMATQCQLAEVTHSQMLELVTVIGEQLKNVGSDKAEYGSVSKVAQNMAKMLCADGLMPSDNCLLMALAVMHSTQKKITNIQRGYQNSGEKITTTLKQCVEDDYSMLTMAGEKLRVARDEMHKATANNKTEPNEDNKQKETDAIAAHEKAMHRVQELLGRLTSSRTKYAQLVQKYLKLQRDFHLNVIKVIDAALEDCANLDRLGAKARPQTPTRT